MTRLSLAAAAISAGLVGGSLWFAGAHLDAGGENAARTSKGMPLQGEHFEERIDGGTSEARSRQNAIRFSGPSGKSGELHAVRETPVRVVDSERQPMGTAPIQKGAEVSSFLHNPATAQSRQNAPSDLESVTPVPLVSQKGFSEARHLDQAALPDSGGSLVSREQMLASDGSGWMSDYYGLSDSGFGWLDHVARDHVARRATRSCLLTLVSPEVLAQISSMSPEQIEAYTYFSGLLLNPHLADGSSHMNAEDPENASFPLASPPESGAVHAFGDIPPAEGGRGWTAFEFLDGGSGLNLEGDDAAVLEVGDGNVVGQRGRAGGASRRGGDIAVTLENDNQISGRAGPLRFRDPVPQESSAMFQPNLLGVSYQTLRQGNSR